MTARPPPDPTQRRTVGHLEDAYRRLHLQEDSRYGCPDCAESVRQEIATLEAVLS